MASLMATTTMAPRPALRRLDPPSTRITSSRRAPELSAIWRIDSCSTTVPPSWSPLLRALDDFDHPPPLGLRQRPRLDDPHRVARLGALLVVRRDLLGAHDLLAVEPVREAAHERHRDGLLHLVAHHYAGPNFAPPSHARFLSAKMVLIRAISRRMARSCNGFSSASVARRNPRRKRSSVSTTSCCSSSSVFISRSASGFFLGMLALLPLHELRLDRQLGRRERQRLARQILGDPLELEHHPARLHHRHPAFGIPLALPHPGLGRLLGDRLVREQSDPHLAASLHLARQGHARGLDLTVRHPPRLERHEPVMAERDRVTAGGHPLGAALEPLAELDALRCQHAPPVRLRSSTCGPTALRSSRAWSSTLSRRWCPRSSSPSTSRT